MRHTVCCWCLSIVKVSKNFNEKTHRAVCSQSCKDAENLFNLHWSDEEINRRAHYRELTKGDDDG